MRPSDGAPGAWFERPTEPDTTVEALEPTSEADLQGSEDEHEPVDGGATSAVDSDESAETAADSDAQN